MNMASIDDFTGGLLVALVCMAVVLTLNLLLIASIVLRRRRLNKPNDTPGQSDLNAKRKTDTR